MKLGTTKIKTKEEIVSSIKKIKVYQNEYFKKTSFKQRIEVLKTIKHFILNNQDLICKISSRDTGKTLLDSTFGEIIPTLEKLNWTIKNGESCLKTSKRDSVGVMGLIVSWNYPFHNVISPLISALMAGNGLAVKCSEHTCFTTEFLSPDLVVFIDGFAEAGETLIENVDKVTFIGSPNVGKLVMEKASKTLTPVILELGGKDAAIIFDDCDYSNMLKICLRGALQNAGQNCAGLERMIVQDTIYDQLVADMSETLSSLRVGSPFEEGVVDIGAITMKNQLSIIQILVDDAVNKGAKVLVGGTPYINPKYPSGQYYTPTLITGVTKEMKLYTEEVFGPVILLFKFKTEKE
ncbi:Meiotic Sister-Chromatid recombination aldehyde dehydrogenase, partial [Clydaea vesicula]